MVIWQSNMACCKATTYTGQHKFRQRSIQTHDPSVWAGEDCTATVVDRNRFSFWNILYPRQYAVSNKIYIIYLVLCLKNTHSECTAANCSADVCMRYESICVRMLYCVLQWLFKNHM
jgi:hypothetical protein